LIKCSQTGNVRHLEIELLVYLPQDVGGYGVEGSKVSAGYADKADVHGQRDTMMVMNSA